MIYFSYRYRKAGDYMKNPEKGKYLFGMLAGFGAISLSVIFFFILYRMPAIGAAVDTVTEILMPFIIGGVIAYLLRPMCNWFEKSFSKILPKKLKKFASGMAVGLSMVTFLLIIYALIIMIAPELYRSVVSLWNTIPDRAKQLYDWAAGVMGGDDVLLKTINDISIQIYQSLDKWANESLVPYITNLMGGVGNIVSGVGMGVWKVLIFLKDFLIGLIVAVYLLAIRKRLARQGVLLVRGALKPKWADLVLEEIAFVDKMFGGFIDGKIVDSAIIGVLCYIGCVIFRFPNALLISVFVGITNVIPFFGPFIGAIPSIFLILIVDPLKALWFALFILALQQLDGNVIGPKILGDRTGLSSFWVLFSIVLFGGLWGLPGMVICVPLFAVIYDTIKKLVYRGLKKNGQLPIWEAYKKDFGEEAPKPRSAEPEKPKFSETEAETAETETDA